MINSPHKGLIKNTFQYARLSSARQFSTFQLIVIVFTELNFIVLVLPPSRQYRCSLKQHLFRAIKLSKQITCFSPNSRQNYQLAAERDGGVSKYRCQNRYVPQKPVKTCQNIGRSFIRSYCCCRATSTRRVLSRCSVAMPVREENDQSPVRRLCLVQK